MTRGIRGATTVKNNEEKDIINNTKRLIESMVDKNDIKMESISHIFISATKDLNATFPAKALRGIPGSTYVPVMCMREIDVPGSLSKCIRVMMVVNTNKKQTEMQHVFHNDAIKLRPELVLEVGE